MTGATTLVSHTRASATETAGAQAAATPALSADGRFLAFTSGRTDLVPNATGNVYLFDRVTGANTLLSPSNDEPLSSRPAISANGRIVAFLSAATDLIPGFSGPPGLPSFSSTTGSRRR